jgi:hypothetical protein
MRRAILTILNMLLITTAAVQVDAALERHAGSDYRGRTARPRGIIRAMEASSWTAAPASIRRTAPMPRL